LLTVYDVTGGRLTPRSGPIIGPDAVWIDLHDPTADEDALVEKMLGIAIPTRAEAREIEASSRLYRENGALYMTAFVLFNAATDAPAGATVTFVLCEKTLVTIRYHEQRAFPIFSTRASRGDLECGAPLHVLLGLIETIVERAADAIERIQDELERIAGGIFGEHKSSHTYSRELDVVLRGVGRLGDVTARLEESTFSIERVLTFLGTALKERTESGPVTARIKSVVRDVRSLTQQMRFLTDRITFLLDATLGSISIEQNKAMKVFSLLAVTLMPPTLVGSIYGMNFKHMPELEWIAGYPIALVLMVLSGVLPFILLRWRGWI
jgi:magnesium transporter